jgi:hypothetical protein
LFKEITKMCLKMIANHPLPRYRAQAKIGLHVGIKNFPEKYQAHFSGAGITKLYLKVIANAPLPRREPQVPTGAPCGKKFFFQKISSLAASA